MTARLRSADDSHLPVPAPDLLAIEDPGGTWRVRSVSPRLAEALGLDPLAARGNFLSRLLPRSVPSLVELATEVAQTGQALSDIRTYLTDGAALWSLEVRPAGRQEDGKRLVAFFLNRPPADEQLRPRTLHGLVGDSPAMREVFRKIALYAPSPAAVVVTGETGTGKELVARALHDQSLRSDGPFIAVNCAAISEELLESELFGHERGAFTGAVRSHHGRFERADGGTLFLDEIGDMPLATQAKLLRVLEEGVVERLGSERGVRVDVRIVAATNMPLEQAVGTGRFRADLYHRLSVLRIHLPPLRERPEDIPLLIEHFLRLFSRKYQRRIQRLTPEAVGLLQAYLWPGNIRELRNVLERVFIETQGEVIGSRAFLEWVRERQDFVGSSWSSEESQPRPATVVLPYDPALAGRSTPMDAAEFSRLSEPFPPDRSRRGRTSPVRLDVAAIRAAMHRANGNLTEAARYLGVHRATLYRYLSKLGLSRADF